MNRWKSVVAGRIAKRSRLSPLLLAILAKQLPDAPRRGRCRAYTRSDVIAKRKRIAKRRAKKGYK